MTVFWRYQLAFVGGFLAMAAHMFLVSGRGGWLAPQRVGNAISAGLMFGHVVALMAVIARDLPFVVRDKWPSRTIRLLSIGGGIVLGSLAWWSHVTLVLFNTNPAWPVLIFGGVGLSLGFIVAPVVPIQNRLTRTAFLIVITTIATFIPVCLTFQNYLMSFNTQSPAQALLYFQVDNSAHVWLIGMPFALSIAVIGQLPLLFKTPES